MAKIPTKIPENILADYRCLLGTKTRPMTDHESQMFITFHMIPLDAFLANTNGQAKLNENFGYKILRSRLESVGAYQLFDGRLLAFLVSICTTPGDVVMWAYTIVRSYKEKKDAGMVFEDGLFGFHEFATFDFPMGLPTREETGRVWDEQKGHAKGVRGVDNLIDISALWPKVTAQNDDKNTQDAGASPSAA